MNSVGIVASHDLEVSPEIATQIAAVILATFGDGYIHVRANSEGISTPIERFTDHLYNQMGPYGWTTVKHHSMGPDRADVFLRDIDLVMEVERLIAFFHPWRIMEGGTGHVVFAALAKEVPVEIWSLDDYGNLINIASDDGFDLAKGERESLLQRYREWERKDDGIFDAGRVVLGGTAMFPSVWTTGTLVTSSPTIPAPTWTPVGIAKSIQINGTAINGSALVYDNGTATWKYPRDEL